MTEIFDDLHKLIRPSFSPNAAAFTYDWLPNTSHSPATATGPQPKSSLQARLLTSANLAWACLRINKPAAPQTAVGLERPVSTPHHPRIYPAWPCPKGLRC